MKSMCVTQTEAAETKKERPFTSMIQYRQDGRPEIFFPLQWVRMRQSCQPTEPSHEANHHITHLFRMC
jgi:hypothetical protein